MALKAISEVPKLVSKISESLSKITGAGSEIISICGEFPSIFTSSLPPLSISIPTAGSVIGTERVEVSAPQIPTITVEPPNIMPETPDIKEISLDACHLDLSIFGTILKAIMTALVMLVEGIISKIVSAINKAISMFMVIVSGISNIMKWLKTTLDNIWKKIGDAYRDVKEKWFEANKEKKKTQIDNTKNTQIAKAKESLYKRILSWFSDKMEKMGKLCARLKTAIGKFFGALYDVLKDIGNLLLVVPKTIADLSEDVACLVKVGTLALK